MSNFYSIENKAVFIHIPKTGGYSIRINLLQPLIQSYGIIPQEWDFDFSFAFVRNPFERFLSTYKMFKYGGLTCKAPHKSSLTPNELLDIVEDESIPYTNNKKDINEFIKHHALPMTHPFNCLFQAQKIYRFEKYSDAIIDIKQILNLTNDVGHNNKSKNPANLSVMSLKSEHIERIKSIYSEDFKQFYPFVDPTNAL